MSDEHLIRLRRGWEVPRDDGQSAYYHLPAPFPGRVGIARLVRRFGQPRMEPGSELFLRFSDSPGLQAILLNGGLLGDAGASAAGELAIGLDRLRARNLLIIDLNPEANPTVESWGHFALVIRRGARG